MTARVPSRLVPTFGVGNARTDAPRYIIGRPRDHAAPNAKSKVKPRSGSRPPRPTQHVT